jgi:hypothetical protein
VSPTRGTWKPRSWFEWGSNDLAMPAMDSVVSSGLFLYDKKEANMNKATTLEARIQPPHRSVAHTPGDATVEASSQVRELDHRHSEGIDVSLLWHARTNRVSIALTDERSGESLSFEIDPSEALSAFHHPYAYAARASEESLRPTVRR